MGKGYEITLESKCVEKGDNFQCLDLTVILESGAKVETKYIVDVYWREAKSFTTLKEALFFYR